MNFFPAYRRTGARITCITADLREIHIKLPLTWRTRNYVGTMFGGSMFAAVDPVYMVMFIELLGPGYIVWDKAAKIRFLRPGRSTLTATFRVDDHELDTIRSTLQDRDRLEREYTIELLDGEDKVCAEVVKLLHFRKKEY